MTPGFDIVVPALSLRHADGSIDDAATRLYAHRAAASTWVDYLILSGSTTQGHLQTSAERTTVLDIWLDVMEPGRLLACCWQPEDLSNAASRSITPMATMRGLESPASALAFLRSLPAKAFIYSHPMFGGATFDASLAASARDSGVLPAGGKLAKISLQAIADVRAVTGAYKLWDGSARRIEASVRAGAAGIVATALCTFESKPAGRDAAALQAAVDRVQVCLDALPDRASRSEELRRRARHVIQ